MIAVLALGFQAGSEADYLNRRHGVLSDKASTLMLSVWGQFSKLFVTNLHLLICFSVALGIVRYHTGNPPAASYVGPSIFNQDLHLIDEAELPRL